MPPPACSNCYSCFCWESFHLHRSDERSMQLTRLCALLLTTFAHLAIGSNVVPCAVPHAWSSAVGKLPRRYEVQRQLIPCFLPGDFDGDGRRDLALTVRGRRSGK